MARFDVWQNPNKATQKHIPYLLEVQSNLLETIATRVVIPLARATERRKPAKYLNPPFVIEKTKVVMLTEQIAGIPLKAVGKHVTTLGNRRDEIMAAVDFLFSGI